jgi:hypothetical protein
VTKQSWDRPTQYVALSDDEFVAELREHLPARSWTIAHLIELERRGLEVAEGDRELHEALTEEFDRIRKVMEPVAKALQERFTAHLQPLQEQLSRTLKTISPKIDLAPLYANFDIDRLTSPDFSSLSYVDLASDAPAISTTPYPEVAESLMPEGSSEAALVSRGELELQSRRAQLELATTSAAQLAALEELVQLAGSRDWFDWLLLALTALAATGAIAAVFVAVVRG